VGENQEALVVQGVRNVPFVNSIGMKVDIDSGASTRHLKLPALYVANWFHKKKAVDVYFLSNQIMVKTAISHLESLYVAWVARNFVIK